jgi:release factor glutamine methyltransferase
MTYNELWRQLVQIYDEGEAKAIARMVYEERFGLTLSDIYLGRETQLSAADQTELEEIAKRLLQGEPIQYVLGQADFCGRTFMVNEHVLIPRPETEELCNWKPLPLPSPKGEGAKILDIGTGSGCIAITLAAMYPEAQVIGWDISEDALEVAKINAIRNNVNVSFEQVDVLNLPSPLPFGGGRGEALSLIVSNPPYICNKERAAMAVNVLEYEPHTALFVPDDDPLLFYRAIAQYGQTALKAGGWLYFEINPLYAREMCDMLRLMSYHDIELKADQYGKQRMIRARKALR